MLLENFEKCSGLKANQRKTEAMWQGSSLNDNASPLGLKWKKCVKALGMYYTYDNKESDQKNFFDKLASVKKEINLWKWRGLSLYGKVTIIKNFLLSKCLYAASVLFQPVRSNNCVPEPRRHFIKIHFHNKGIDKVNLHNMLHNKLVNSKVPIYFKEKEPPVISYKYTDNISRKVFNYNQTLSDVNLSKYGNWNQSCDCKSSTFCYEPYGHIITLTSVL